MKKNVKKEELKKLDTDSLKQELNNMRKELFNLRLSFRSGEVKDYSQFKKVKTNIARCFTFLKQQERSVKSENKKV